MGVFDHQTYLDLIAKVDGAATPDTKGNTFEDLAQYLLSCLKGVEIAHRDAVMQSEEIDLVVWNARTDEVLRSWSDVILVECKNWSSKVDAKNTSWFLSKLEERSLNTGLLIAASGVTGDYDSGDPTGARDVIRKALGKGIRIITITMDDLRQINSHDDLLRLLKLRFLGLFVFKVLADWQPATNPIAQAGNTATTA